MFAAAKNLGDGSDGMGDLLTRLRAREKARCKEQVLHCVKQESAHLRQQQTGKSVPQGGVDTSARCVETVFVGQCFDTEVPYTGRIWSKR